MSSDGQLEEIKLLLQNILRILQVMREDNIESRKVYNTGPK